MSNLELTLRKSDGHARQGFLQVNGHRLETPALVHNGDELEKLSSFQIDQAGVKAIKTNGLKMWVKYDSTIEKMEDLHQLFHWDGILLVDPATEYAYHLAKPRGKKHDGVRFHEPTNGQLKFWQPEIASQVQKILGADIFQSFDQATDYYAPVDDLQAGVQQTAEWLLAGENQKGQTVGSVGGGGLKRLRHESITAVDKAGLGGYRLSGIPSNLDDQEFKRIINEITTDLVPTKLRYLASSLSVEQMLTAVLAGVDLIDSDLAARKAANGVALVNYGLTSLHLDRQHFSFDSQVIDSQCGCPSCQNGYSKALLHELIDNQRFYGEQLLLEHNLFTLNQLMKRLRQAIQNQEIEKFIAEMLQNR